MFACQNNPTCPFSYCPTISQSSTYILEEKMNGDCIVNIVLGDGDVSDNANDMMMRTMQIISEKKEKKSSSNPNRLFHCHHYNYHCQWLDWMLPNPLIVLLVMFKVMNNFRKGKVFFLSNPNRLFHGLCNSG